MLQITDGDEELAGFVRDLRATLVAPPTGAAAVALPALLAHEASAGAMTAPPAAKARGRRRGPLPARPLLRIAVAIAAIPLLFTGLAVAGVNLPAPAKSVFEAIGIELPNQSNDGGAAAAGDGAGTAHDGDSARSETGQSNSSGKIGDPKATGNPGARTTPETNAGENRGGAGGQHGLVPGAPGASGEGDADDMPGYPGPPPGVGPPESPGNSGSSHGAQGNPPGGVPEGGPSGSPSGGGDPRAYAEPRGGNPPD